MWIISSTNVMYIDLCLQETCYIFISFSRDLLHVDFPLRETRAFFFLAKQV